MDLCFAEIVIGLAAALRALGFVVVTRQGGDGHAPLDCGRLLIIAGNGLDNDTTITKLPRDTIVYQLEQFNSPWLKLPHYIKLLQRCVVWDFSPSNVRMLRKLGCSRVQLCRIGYAPELERINHSVTQDIDVLFYGSMNKRRQKIISRLRQAGIAVTAPCEGGVPCYGKERDDLIARSKIVLNLHYYADACLEVARVSYPLANQVVVVSEKGSDTELDDLFATGIVFADTDDLVEMLQITLNQKRSELRGQGVLGRSALLAIPQVDEIQRCLSHGYHWDALDAVQSSATVLIGTVQWRLESTLRLLELLEHQTRAPDRIVVCPDGYDAAVLGKLQRFARSMSIPTLVVEHAWSVQTPLHGPGARWQTIQTLGLPASELILCIDDDILVPSQYVAKMATACEEYGAVSAMGTNPNGDTITTESVALIAGCKTWISDYDGELRSFGAGLSAIRLGLLHGLMEMPLASEYLGYNGHDEILLAAHLWRQKVPIRYVRVDGISFDKKLALDARATYRHRASDDLEIKLSAATGWKRPGAARPALESAFTHIARTDGFNVAGGGESLSGPGSSLAQTVRLRDALPGVLRELEVRSLLDAPCGDFHWMKDVALDGIAYIGGEIVSELIWRNVQKYSSSHRKFMQLDIVSGALPTVDAVFCRDCLVHLSNADSLLALRNMAWASRYLLLTTFTDVHRVNQDTVSPAWRVLNLCREPFNLPAPLLLINEGCSEENGAFADKSIGVWKSEDILRVLDGE